jgi:hypothetical protein
VRREDAKTTRQPAFEHLHGIVIGFRPPHAYEFDVVAGRQRTQQTKHSHRVAVVGRKRDPQREA